MSYPKPRPPHTEGYGYPKSRSTGSWIGLIILAIFFLIAIIYNAVKNLYNAAVNINVVEISLSQFFLYFFTAILFWIFTLIFFIKWIFQMRSGGYWKSIYIMLPTLILYIIEYRFNIIRFSILLGLSHSFINNILNNVLGIGFLNIVLLYLFQYWIPLILLLGLSGPIIHFIKLYSSDVKRVGKGFIKIYHSKSGIPTQRFQLDIFGVGNPYKLRKIFQDKANQNILITGSSGMGKTTLLDYLILNVLRENIIVFNFKPHDHSLRLPGFIRIDACKFLPYPFFSKSAFITAYLQAYPLEKGSWMASSLPALLWDLLNNTHSFSELFAKINEHMNTSDDKIEKGILAKLKSDLKPLIDGLDFTKEEYFKWDLKTNIILDFSNLNNEFQKTFYAELMLQYIWNYVSRHRPLHNFYIAVDEAHRLLKKVFLTEFQPVLNIIAREIRSLGGGLIISTQNLSDINMHVVNQFATIFIFNTGHKEDLESLNRISEVLSYTAPKLRPTHCLDARQDNLLNDLRILRFKKPSLLSYELKPLEMLPDNLKYRVEREEETPETSAQPTVVKMEETPSPQLRDTGETVKIDYDMLKADVINLLRNRCSYVSELGRELESKYGKPAYKLKVDIHIILKDLVGSGLVMKSDFIDRRGKRLVLYWLRESGESPFHRALISHTLDLLYRYNLDAKLLNSPEGGCDIVLRDICVECESGFKADLDKFKEAMYNRLKRYREVWVIVPNKHQRDRYSKALKNIRIKIFMLPDLDKHLREGKF